MARETRSSLEGRASGAHRRKLGIATLGATLGVCCLVAQSPAGAVAHGNNSWTPAAYVNRQMPTWVRLSGEYRVRFEGRTAFGYRAGSNDAYTLGRLRLTLDAAPSRHLRFVVQAQDSRVAAILPSRANASFKNSIDVRLASLQVGSTGDHGAKLQVGRLELSYGSQRLIGEANWGNTARSFDAVRLIIDGSAARVDLFASSVVVIDPTNLDKRRGGENLHGIYGSLVKLAPGLTVEPYFLWRTRPLVVSEGGTLGDADVFTGGVRLAARLPGGLDFSAELVRQGGHSSADRIAAGAFYVIAGYTTGLPTRPRFSVEADYASGDRARGDGVAGTFDHLYPTNHSYYGIADQVGWRNMRAARAGVDCQPWPKLTVALNLNWFWLVTRNDGLYNASGTLTVPAPPGGARSAYVGNELDVLAAFAPNKTVTLGAGFGHLFPGRFLKEASPGSGTSFPYAFVTYAF